MARTDGIRFGSPEIQNLTAEKATWFVIGSFYQEALQ
jgi:hypothetical protein